MKKIFLCLAVIALSFAMTFTTLAVVGDTANLTAIDPGTTVSVVGGTDLSLAGLDLWAAYTAFCTLLASAVMFASLIAPLTSTTTDDKVVAVAKSLLARLSLFDLGALRANPNRQPTAKFGRK